MMSMGYIDVITPPACPLCGESDRVEQDRLYGGCRIWLCGSCWTAFRGGQHEWMQYQERRDRRKAG